MIIFLMDFLFTLFNYYDYHYLKAYYLVIHLKSVHIKIKPNFAMHMINIR